MGTDKSLLVVDGARLADRALAALRGASVAPLFISGHGGTDFAPDVAVVPDLVGSAGPLEGIVSTWAHILAESVTSIDRLVVLSCDLPLIAPALVTDLLAASTAHTAGAVAHDGDRPQPLVAVYRRAALDEMAQAYAAGERSVRRLFPSWDLGQVHAPQQAIDADEPGDLAAYRVEWPVGHEVGGSK